MDGEGREGEGKAPFVGEGSGQTQSNPGYSACRDEMFSTMQHRGETTRADDIKPTPALLFSSLAVLPFESAHRVWQQPVKTWIPFGSQCSQLCLPLGLLSSLNFCLSSSPRICAACRFKAALPAESRHYQPSWFKFLLERFSFFGVKIHCRVFALFLGALCPSKSDKHIVKHSPD